jgi:hydrogenase/urease accessory protein HupE
MGKARPRQSPASRWFALFCGILCLAAALWPSTASAHSPTFNVYSKYEATTLGNRVAFVFALDKMAVLALIQRDVTHDKVEPADVPQYRDFLTKFVFDRFTVSNAGVACSHPDHFEPFYLDEHIGHLVAVTSFTCPSALTDLTIHSVVTHDMPYSHELVGDLQVGATLVRHFFLGDDVEARIDIGSLPPSGTVQPWRPRRRNQFSYVPEPGPGRIFNALTAAELGVDVSSLTTGPSSTPTPAPEKPAGLFSFIGQGILHIFTGYDHVLFIVTLMLVVRSWKELAIIVTSFTAAHSLTLAVATLGLVTIPSRYVEPLIALTVLLVAVDGILRPDAKARAVVAFGFGLIHGLGLSNALRELGLSGRELLPALFGFNIGVEIGQLLIVGPLFWLVLWLRKRETLFVRTRNVMCASVALIAVFWIVVRVREALLG